MKNKIILGFALFSFISASYAQPGTLDNTFADGAEIKNLNFLSSDEEWMTHSIVDAQDRTWIAGYTLQDGDWAILLVRLTPDGDYDETFAGTGHAVINIAADNIEYVHGLALQGNDLIIAGHMIEDDVPNQFALKYTEAGGIDSEFGELGITVVPAVLIATDVTTDSDGNIYISGVSEDNVVVTKLLPDGSVDANFGFFGAAFAEFPSTDQSTAVTVDDDGNVFVFGYGTLGGVTRGQITSFLPTGAINTDFTANGRKSFTWPDDKQFQVSDGILNNAGDEFYLVGHAEDPDTENKNVAMIAVGTDSNQNMDFAGNGWFEVDLAIGGTDLANQIIEGESGLYIAANVQELPVGINSAVIHTTTTGEMVDSFGNLGIGTYNIIASGADQALDLNLQSDGKIILSGIALNQEIGVYGYAARILTSPSTGISEEPQATAFSIYPNPARDYVWVAQDGSQGVSNTFRIHSSNGQLIQQGMLGATEQRLDISTLSPGMYQVVIGNEAKTMIKSN